MTVPVDDVAVQARLQPERVAAIELASGRRWSYAALDADIGRCAAVLSGLGLVAGDRLATFVRNRMLLPMLHLACARLGILYVPLNRRLAEEEIDALLADCAPTLLVHDDGREGGLAIDDLDAMVAAATPAQAVAFDRTRPSLILYTSGTSGGPKGALLSEAAIAETAINFGLLGQVDRASRVLSDAPMFHVIGLVANIRPYWLHGGAVLVSDGFDPERTLARIADSALGVTHYFCVPQMATMLRRASGFDPTKLKGLTAIFTGGAPNPAADVLAWLDDGIAMVNGYGMSENGTLIGMPIDIAEIRKRPTAAGIPTARVALRVVDGDDRALPAGVAGEVQVRGANLASGYWHRPEETACAFLANGWFRTGDIGVIDADGFVSIVDRKKDMFISGGENVYPAEIEAVLAEHPGIAECAVIGVPDARWGEVGHLAIVAVEDATIDPAAVLASVAQRLARYKVPKHVSLLSTLPRNGAGKVLKVELRRMLG